MGSTPPIALVPPVREPDHVHGLSDHGIVLLHPNSSAWHRQESGRALEHLGGHPVSDRWASVCAVLLAVYRRLGSDEGALMLALGLARGLRLWNLHAALAVVRAWTEEPDAGVPASCTRVAA
jgi:hypothetical protein